MGHGRVRGTEPDAWPKRVSELVRRLTYSFALAAHLQLITFVAGQRDSCPHPDKVGGGDHAVRVLREGRAEGNALDPRRVGDGDVGKHIEVAWWRDARKVDRRVGRACATALGICEHLQLERGGAREAASLHKVHAVCANFVARLPARQPVELTGVGVEVEPPVQL
eukprot:534536-Hanusia_phi.AAC.1